MLRNADIIFQFVKQMYFVTLFKLTFLKYFIVKVLMYIVANSYIVNISLQFMFFFIKFSFLSIMHVFRY